jgi:hypothetical protein
MTKFGKPEKTTEHHYFEERLSAYLDDELLPEERDAVEHHLSACQVCQWELDTLSKTVQWTRELPTVPVPHVFTIQVPARPERTMRWRWGLVPALQAATALVALLLFFTVAGDYMLSGFGIARAPEPMFMEQPAPSMVDATQVLELAQEAPAGERTGVETIVVETVVVEAERAVEVQAEKAVTQPTPGPMPTHALEAAAPEEAEPLAAELAEGEIAPDEVPPPEPVVGSPSAESQADELDYSAAPSPTVELEAPIAAGGESESMAPPTALAAAEVEELEVPDQPPARTLRRPIAPWLRVTEYALGVVLLVLAATTLVVMIQRRRSG